MINVREKPVLDPELLRHLPLQYGQSVKADDTRISEETRRTRCSRVIITCVLHVNLLLLLLLNYDFLFNENRWFSAYWIICKGGSGNEDYIKTTDIER